MRLEEIFVLLLAREVLEKRVDDSKIRDTLTETPQMLYSLYELSKMHDMAHIICLALKNIGAWGDGEVFKKFQRQQNLSVYRCEQMRIELGKVGCELEKSHIPYMFLKGACVSLLYPQSWMRTSSDIDILVKAEDKKAAEDVVVTECGYVSKSHSGTEITLHNPEGFCVELHHGNGSRKIEEIPQDVWENATCDEGTYRYIMTGEMLYYHIISHMTKHVAWSGCGIKPFLDMYILEKKLELDFDKIKLMLEKGKLYKAYKALHRTAEVWFDGAQSDKLTSIIRKHVLMGGSYGNQITGTNMTHRNKGGKVRYILWLLLPDRMEMERRYPVLRVHPSRLPIYHIKRWGHLIFGGRIKSSAEIVKTHMGFSDENAKELDYMLKEMEIK